MTETEEDERRMNAAILNMGVLPEKAGATEPETS
jgi:hypothetical protein